MSLLAEDLLLLALDDESGKAIVDSITLPRALAGAVLLELALDNVVLLDDKGEGGKKSRVVVGSAVPVDPILTDAVARLDRRRPMKPAAAIEKLSKNMRDTVLERVVANGWVREERGKVLGLFPARRWPAVDDSHERRVRNELHSVLVDGTTPSPRAAALISLLSATKSTPKIFPDADKKRIAERAKDIAEGQWAGQAVRQAVDAINTAILVAVTVPAVVASS
ncbi:MULTISPECIES: GPP34 family phosphoprotein [unclassified Rhodococcus (in: high G+C Gram-positive bacteria)]|uniref:GOLPH3/VPS74 family protein n=1 Tax=Rhodococcus sp. SJ-3 TaxID=3454628 RepID=UPI003F798193